MISFSNSFNDMTFENNKFYSEKFKVLDGSGSREDGLGDLGRHDLSSYDYFIQSSLRNKHTHTHEIIFSIVIMSVNTSL